MANVPGGRFWEPTEEKTAEEQEQEWKEFEKWVEEHDGFAYDPELPFQ